MPLWGRILEGIRKILPKRKKLPIKNKAFGQLRPINKINFKIKARL